jgi:hypothetical protein
MSLCAGQRLNDMVWYNLIESTKHDEILKLNFTQPESS